MASALGDKINQTQNSFPSRQPGAVESCPFAKPVAAKNDTSPVEVKNAFALTQYGSTAPTAATQPEKAKEKKDWIEIILVGTDGKPIPDVRYRITPPGGDPIKEGRLNEHGQAGYYQIKAGNCKITFPDLDKEAWE